MAPIIDFSSSAWHLLFLVHGTYYYRISPQGRHASFKCMAPIITHGTYYYRIFPQGRQVGAPRSAGDGA